MHGSAPAATLKDHQVGTLFPKDLCELQQLLLTSTLTLLEQQYCQMYVTYECISRDQENNNLPLLEWVSDTRSSNPEAAKQQSLVCSAPCKSAQFPAEPKARAPAGFELPNLLWPPWPRQQTAQSLPGSSMIHCFQFSQKLQLICKQQYKHIKTTL